jgi:hypothetical protein
MKLPRRNFLHLAAGAAALPAASGTTPVPPEPGPSPTVSKKFVADFGAPTDGVTSANAALNRWKQFGQANPGAELVIEAGKYQFPQGFAPLYGCVNPTITGAGSDKTELVMGTDAGMFIGTANTFPQVRSGFVPIATVDAGATKVTVLNSAEVSKLNVGRWVAVGSMTNQGGNDGGYPPNLYMFEYHKITAINGTTVTLDGALKMPHHPDWPPAHLNQFQGVDPFANSYCEGGPACLVIMAPKFDSVAKMQGFTITTPIDTFFSAVRDVTFQDIVWNLSGKMMGPAVSMAQIARFIDCDIGQGQNEVDKICERVEYTNCRGKDILMQSTSIQEIVFDGCTFDSIVGCGKRTTIRNCTLNMLQAGSIYGACDSLVIENSTVWQGKPAYHMQDYGKLNNYRNGTLTVPFSDLDAQRMAMNLFAPGHTYIAGYYYGASATTPDGGTPPFSFTVTGIRSDATNIYIDTDLTVATLPTLTYLGGNPQNSWFGIPFKSVTETGLTGQSFAKVAYQTEL